MMKNLFLLALLISYTGRQVASEKTFIDKVLARAAQSKMAYWWNDLLCEGLGLSGEPVSADVQLLADEAQENVGIPKTCRVSVRLQSMDNHTAAMASFNAIYVNPTTFSNPHIPYGVKRCDLHHEAVHIKYHDWACKAFLGTVTFLSIPIVAVICRPQGALKLIYPLSVVSGWGASRLAKKNYASYYERRADQEGHAATGCYSCVQEKVKDIRGISKEACYLSVAENETIAAKLQRQNKLCTFHKKQGISKK